METMKGGHAACEGMAWGSEVAEFSKKNGVPLAAGMTSLAGLSERPGSDAGQALKLERRSR
jgi:hypothetical protein